jgi:Heterokaryon incompatibility protein (HET)
MPGKREDPGGCGLFLIYCGDGRLPWDGCEKVAENSGNKSPFLVLRRLWKRKDARIIWIDALCINQADLVEKSHQVNFMGKIYEHTTQVLIWIGDYSSAPSTAPDTQTTEEATDLQ